MMRSMYSGVSGLRVHQTKMDVIGNNISNVNTAGFKSSRVTFSEVFSQTLQGASGANAATGRGGTNPMQIGLGVDVASIDNIMTEGASQRTDNPLDLKIEGEGFFIVDDGTGPKFTRAGAFRPDDFGNLVTPEGYRVMGWPVDGNNDIQQGMVEPLSIMSPQNLYSDPEATTDVYVEGNIDLNDPQLATDNGVPFTFNFYDNLGYRYTAEFNIVEDGDNYQIGLTNIYNSNGDPIDENDMPDFDLELEFDATNGRVVGDGLGELNGLVNAAGEEFGDINIDFSSLTLFSGNTNIDAHRGDQDGYGAGSAAGTLSGYSVGPDGIILGTYTNGDVKNLGQIVITEFRNPSGLEKIGNNLFAATNNSGEFDGIGMDPTANGGSLNGGVLEMSNVDLSQEFTEMITTQRGFQANSRTITTTDEMLQELVNLKR
ncbi:flagellar hook protein FlgE [Natranaerovirga hydrolytica]|uniref:Flagellar hook protein FlgE n=1 Tax=Natranaerovirga hydrolytica TaxID=680378 RepID=A0A4R1MXG3_9FIRM|nr:flagellar hook protein FlgE [Natranaerovirga hydrolytica]TCK97896.1 flagellar hook protein FlgE [Natranaerovirga hydrolytica]